MSLCVSHTHRIAKVNFPRVGEFDAEVVDLKESSSQVMGVTRDIRVKIATEQAEFEEAFALLAANYRARGYESPGDKPYRFTPYHALPTTVTVVAKREGEVVATLSFVPDTELLGLPMESIFGEEIAGLRREGRRMAEAFSLADSGLLIHEFIQVFKALIKLAMQYHASRGGDTAVITVNPRHRSFYQKVLGFKRLGPRRNYPTVQDHPAEAYLLEFESMKENAPPMYQEVFGESLAESILTAGRWSVERVRYFGRRSTQIEAEVLEDLLDAIEQSGATPRWSEGDLEADPFPGLHPLLDDTPTPIFDTGPVISLIMRLLHLLR
ncbi:MAG: hypothetical protein JOZ53_20260, partial [Planctomycetaceae bacterium]|nr:hypothetical protein [Planctomycetaceae bacterium]